MRKRGLGLSVEDVVKIQTLLDVADACVADCEEILVGDGSPKKELDELVGALAEIRTALEEVAEIVEVDE